ncbi:uncharacterized protein FFNC_14564 [Fusarium fujikuroi]|nr:uncharacterized protein FFNC_14564 [Fusarium fujikuroi]
MLACSILIR